VSKDGPRPTAFAVLRPGPRHLAADAVLHTRKTDNTGI